MEAMKISKERLLKSGNSSLAIGAIFSMLSLSCPCPTCIGTASICLLNSAREKLGVSLSGLLEK